MSDRNRSIRGGRVILADSLYGNADDPMCASMTRDGVLNNSLHYADSYSQVRVNWVAPDGFYLTANPTAFTGSALPGSSRDFHWADVARFGPFPLTMDSTGTPYSARLRIATSASGSSTRFRAVLCPFGTSALYRVETDPFIWQSSTGGGAIGAAVSWTDGYNPTDSSVTSHVLSFDSSEDYSSWIRTTTVRESISTTTPSSSVDQTLVELVISVVIDPADQSPEGRLHGVHLAEWLSSK